jgi:magnesium chelatase subunit I
VLTHYPQDLAAAHAITAQEAWLDRDGGVPAVRIPALVADIVEAIAFEGRESEYVDQSSGVSARLAIAARELLASQVERRVIRNPKEDPVPRLLDLGQLAAAIVGKVELVHEGEQEGAVQVARHLIGRACQRAFDARFPDVIQEGAEGERGKPPKADRYRKVLDWFAQGNRLELADEMTDENYLAALSAVPGLDHLAREFIPEAFAEAPGPAMELVLEGLHQHSLLAKEDVKRGAAYSDMMGILMRGLK